MGKGEEMNKNKSFIVSILLVILIASTISIVLGEIDKINLNKEHHATIEHKEDIGEDGSEIKRSIGIGPLIPIIVMFSLILILRKYIN